MKIEYRKKFLKELSKLPNEYAETIETFVFEELPACKSLEEAGKIEKMKGYKQYFKVRFGNYRVGIRREEDGIIIETVRHRKEIYKFFP